tara:strand:- start:105 stop:1772 length:1668 start_codon:yes stop_codon:yes gene_type:complete
MNFGKIYIKSALFLIQMLLTFNFVCSQEYSIEFEKTSATDKKIKKYDSYKDLILAIEDSLINLKQKGYTYAKVESFIKKDSFKYKIIINKNQKIKFIQISNELELEDEIINILKKYKQKSGLIKFDQIETIIDEISNFISSSGYPFAEVSFKNFNFVSISTIESKINIVNGPKRHLDKVITKGYENFPKKFIKNIFKLNKKRVLDIDDAIERSKSINKTQFARNTRDPEILFSKDTTTLYLYLEKIKRNSFDGLISFNSDEESNKIKIQGYIKINLINTFNRGENVEIDFKSQTESQRSLYTNLYFPFIFGSNLNFRHRLNLTQQDSIFSSTENFIEIDSNFGKIKTGVGFQNIDSKSENNFEYIENFKSQLINIFCEYSNYDFDDILISKDFSFAVKYGFGEKTQININSNLNKLKIELYKKFNLSPTLKLESKVIKEEIDSKNMVNNELLRFGGSNSMRGFEDQSIFTNNYLVLNNNLNLYLSNTIYIYAIFDLANYKNRILNFEEDLYSVGFGFSSKTENGIISINYSKGNNWGNSFNIKNGNIGVNITTFF